MCSRSLYGLKRTGDDGFRSMQPELELSFLKPAQRHPAWWLMLVGAAIQLAPPAALHAHGRSSDLALFHSSFKVGLA
jgi:hypothetical protein